MVAATGRSTALRRAGSFVALLAFEAGAVVLLTRLGNVPSLRIPWHSLTPWIVNSPVEDVLAAILRTIALLVAWWLLASNLLYLLARLTHVPSAIRAVRWLTLPVVRRATDHALALTLATSLMGAGSGTALAATTPVVATAPQRAGAAEPYQRTVVAGPLGYAPGPAGEPRAEASAPAGGLPGYLPRPADAMFAQPPASKPDEPGYVPKPASGRVAAQPSPTSESTSTTSSTTSPPSSTTTTTSPASTTTSPPSTEAPTTTSPTTSTAPPRTNPTSTTAPAGTAPATTGTPPTTTIYIPRPAGPPSTTSTTGPRSTSPPATPPSTTGPPGGNQGQAPTPQPTPPERQPSGSHRVVQGDNLWTISRDHLAAVTNRRSSDLSDHEIATYWLRVIAVNRASLRSGNPDLIFPGELIMFPPVSTQA